MTQPPARSRRGRERGRSGRCPFATAPWLIPMTLDGPSTRSPRAAPWAIQYHGAFVLVFSGTMPDARRRALAAECEEATRRPLSSLGLSRHPWPHLDAERAHEPALQGLWRTMVAVAARSGPCVMSACRWPMRLSATRCPSIWPALPTASGTSRPWTRPAASCSRSWLTRWLRAACRSSRARRSTPTVRTRSSSWPLPEPSASGPASRPSFTTPLIDASDVSDSFPVIDLVAGSAVLDGHVPLPLIDAIVGLRFDTTTMRPRSWASRVNDRHGALIPGARIVTIR